MAYGRFDPQQGGGLNPLLALQQFDAGQQSARENRLFQIAEQAKAAQGRALAGDKGAQAELLQLDPDRGMQTQSYMDDRKKADTAEFLGAAYAAKTPEQWKMVVDRFRQKGHNFDPGEDAFENRDSLLRQGMSVADQMGIDLKSKEFAAETARWERQFAATQAHQAAVLAQDQSQHEDTLALGREKVAAEEGKAMRPDLKDITSIRKEIGDLPSYKTYSAALPVYNSMTKAADTKAGDLNLVYGLAKIYDPTSVVRESEQVLVQNTASLPDWLVGQINALNGGARLQPQTRTALMAEARNRVDSYKSAYDSNLGQYRGFAQRHQINEADIIPEMGAIEEFKSPNETRRTKSGIQWSPQ